MILVKIEGIPGDCQIEGYKNEWFTVNSFSFGVEREQTESAKGGTDDLSIGLGLLKECTFEKSTDKSSNLLMKYSINGGPLPGASIYFVQTKDGGGKQNVYPYLMFALQPCFVKTWSVSGSEDGRPTESVSLWYNKIVMTYFQYSRNAKGEYEYGAGLSADWNQVTNSQWADAPKLTPK